MRTIRTLTAGLACMVLLPAVAAAQAPQPAAPQTRTFTDSWYWGAKGGVSLFGAAAEDISAPSVGAEWMITRTKVAMYVSVEQSFFDTQGAVFDPTSTGSARIVDIKDSRRYNLQLFAFPKQFGAFRPYAGLGFALISIREEVTRTLLRAQIQIQDPAPPPLPDFITTHFDPLSGDDDTMDFDAAMAGLGGPAPRTAPLPPLPPMPEGTLPPESRNALCPCGSGRKFKHCHGALA